MEGEMTKRTFVLLAVVVLIAVGCASGWHETNREDIAQPNVALLYGYMDMTDAPSPLDYFHIKQIKPETGKGTEWGFGCRDLGDKKFLFYHQAIPVGTYQLDEFGGTSTVGFLIFILSRTLHKYSFMNADTMNPDLKKPSNDTNSSSLVIDEPGIYFLGRFKYVKVQEKDGDESFTIEKISTPSQASVIQNLYKHMDVKGTKWDKMLLDQMKKLGVQPLN
jgi:hypothetical protein